MKFEKIYWLILFFMLLLRFFRFILCFYKILNVPEWIVKWFWIFSDPIFKILNWFAGFLSSHIIFNLQHYIIKILLFTSYLFKLSSKVYCLKILILLIFEKVLNVKLAIYILDLDWTWLFFLFKFKARLFGFGLIWYI